MQVSYKPDFSGIFNDLRLEKRATQLWDRLFMGIDSSIRQISFNKAEQKAFYRLLNNGKVMENQFIQEALSHVESNCTGKHILCIQDTSEINLMQHGGRLKPGSGIGKSAKSKDYNSFMTHATMALDAEHIHPIGFSSILLFDRPEERGDKHERNYSTRPIEEKESYKWIQAGLESKQHLAGAAQITFIEDREGDIYEQFVRIPDAKTHLIVRSRTTRNLVDGGDMYQTVLSTSPVGTYTVQLYTDIRKLQTRKSAELEIRYENCLITKPTKLTGKDTPKQLSINCIIVNEVGKKSGGINWKLLTTHPVNSFADALQIIDWYASRWHIEQMFRILKSDGFDIESSELESGWAIRKLLVMQMTAALRILQLQLCIKNTDDGPHISTAFNTMEVEAMKILNTQLQGKTEKLSNPYQPHQLKYAAWIIARLGGWSGYVSQEKPGVITMKNGLDKFNHMFAGYMLFKLVGTQ